MASSDDEYIGQNRQGIFVKANLFYDKSRCVWLDCFWNNWVTV